MPLREPHCYCIRLCSAYSLVGKVPRDGKNRIGLVCVADWKEDEKSPEAGTVGDGIPLHVPGRGSRNVAAASTFSGAGRRTQLYSTVVAATP
jgi:hypothetical protein